MSGANFNLRFESMLLWAIALLAITVNIIAVSFPRPQPPVAMPQKPPLAGNYTVPWWVFAPENERHEAMRGHLDSICNNLK